jgi:hypothetical protein
MGSLRLAVGFAVIVIGGLAVGGTATFELDALAASPDASSASSPARAQDDKTGAAGSSAANRVIDAGPGDYLYKLRALAPGDTLRLAPGTYAGIDGTPGLPVYNLHGRPDAPIVITGPDRGARPLFVGTAEHNTVRIANASHVVLRNFDVDGRNLGGDGVNGQGVSHHITLENLAIRGVGAGQGSVGISTNRAPAWNWTIRRCTIVGAGTGMYLGNSDGRNPFVAGVIEHNLVRDTIGYSLQIKHQLPWPADVALPAAPTVTIIRHNVFSKRSNGARGVDARPNLLVGDVPVSGPGRDNRYEIYGNFLFQNPTEALFQGEGNLAFYANVLVNDGGGGVAIQRHNGHVRDVHVFGNTIVTAGTGISIVGGEPAYTQRAAGNAVFASVPIAAPDQESNVVGTFADASSHLVDADAGDERLDLRPKARALRANAVVTREWQQFTDWDRDFDDKARDWRVRGAFASGASGPGWPLQVGIKPARRR